MHLVNPQTVNAAGEHRGSEGYSVNLSYQSFLSYMETVNLSVLEADSVLVVHHGCLVFQSGPESDCNVLEGNQGH